MLALVGADRAPPLPRAPVSSDPLDALAAGLDAEPALGPAGESGSGEPADPLDALGAGIGEQPLAASPLVAQEEAGSVNLPGEKTTRAAESGAGRLGLGPGRISRGAALPMSLDVAQTMGAVPAQEALDQAIRLGIPPDVAFRERERTARLLKRRTLPVDEIARSRALSAFFADPIQAAAGQDHAADFVALKRSLEGPDFSEEIAARATFGLGNRRQGELVYGQMAADLGLGTVTPEAAAEWQKLKERTGTGLEAAPGPEALSHQVLDPDELETFRTLSETLGPLPLAPRRVSGIERALGSAAEQATGSLLPVIEAAPAGALVMGAVPATIAVGATLAGQPQIAGPAAALVGPSMTAGAGAAGAEAMFRLNLAESYAGLQGITTEKGEPVAPEAIAGAAILAGAAKAGLDVLSLAATLELVPGGPALMAGLKGPAAGARAALVKSLGIPGTAEALARFASSYFTAIGTEAVTEDVQTRIDFAARRTTAELAGGAALLEGIAAGAKEAVGPEASAEAALAREEAARATAVFGLAGGIGSAVTHGLSRIQRSRREAEQVAELDKALGALGPMLEKAPESARRLIQDLADEAGQAEVYLQPAAIPAEALAAFSPETRAEVLAAASEGRKAAIPTGEYALHVAPRSMPSKEGATGNVPTGPEARLSPDGLTAEEQNSLLESFEEEVAARAVALDPARDAARLPAASAFGSRIRESLLAAGRPAEEAGIAALVAERALLTHARRRGITVEEAEAELPRLRFAAPSEPLGLARPDLAGAPVRDLARLRRSEAYRKALAEIQNPAREGPAVRYPVLGALRDLGGIDPASPVAGELRAMGINRKTLPGLFRKPGLDKRKRQVGLGAIDNLPRSENPLLAGLPVTEGTDYLDPQGLLDAIRSELRGQPTLTEEAQQERTEREARHREILDELEAAGIELTTATEEEAIEALLAADARAIDELFQPGFQGSKVKRLVGGRMSTEFVGSGENTLNEGWGLYFTSKQHVAEWYRRTLSRKAPSLLFEGERVSRDPSMQPGSYDSLLREIEFQEATAAPYVLTESIPTRAEAEAEVADRLRSGAASALIEDDPESGGYRVRFVPRDDDPEGIARARELAAEARATLAGQAQRIAASEVLDAYLETGYVPAGAGVEPVQAQLAPALLRVQARYRDALAPAKMEEAAALAATAEELFANARALRDTFDANPDPTESQRIHVENAVAGAATTRRLADQRTRESEEALAVRDALLAMRSDQFTPVEPGQVFQVELPEDDELLQWEKPISEQSEGVKSALRALDVLREEEGEEVVVIADGDTVTYEAPAAATGRAAYASLAEMLGYDGGGEQVADAEAMKRASLALLAEGVPGHSYISRSKNRNFVIYSGEPIEVQRTFYQPAFHGTRVKKLEGGKFSLEKVGTGEGAAAYGWGLYFTSKKDIAEFYRKSLAGQRIAPHVKLGGRTINDATGREELDSAESATLDEIEDVARRWPDDPGEGGFYPAGGWSQFVIRTVRAHFESAIAASEEAEFGPLDPRSLDRDVFITARRRWLEVLDRWEAEGIEVGAVHPGQVFKVELPEDAELMDWDREGLEHQPRAVTTLLRELGLLLRDEKEGDWRFWPGNRPGVPAEEVTGEMVYKALVSRARDDVESVFSRVTTGDASAAQRVSMVLAAAGIKGHSYIGHESGTRNYVIYDDAAVEVVETYYQNEREIRAARALVRKLRGREAARDTRQGRNYALADEIAGAEDALARLLGIDPTSPDYDPDALDVREEFEAGPPENPRGSITLDLARRDALIAFTRISDPSTIFHELGHYYTLSLLHEASQENAPAWLARDASVLRAFAGAAEGEALTTPQAEKLAEGFVAYLRTGKAPSADLKSAFARMRDWLVELYRTVKELIGVEALPEEVRQVFDRLLATDEEIARVREDELGGSIFAEADLSPEERSAIEHAMRLSAAETKNALDKVQLAELGKRRGIFEKVAKERAAKVAEERARIREEVRAEVERQQAWRADHYLRTGQLLGVKTPEGLPAVKLSRPAMLELFGADSDAGRAIAAVPTGARSWLSATKGVDPETVAEQLGYDTGAELVRALLAIGSREAGSRERVVDEITDARMKAAEALPAGELEAAALKAMRTEARMVFLETEDRVLSAKSGNPAAEGLREHAAAIIAAREYRHLRPDMHRRVAINSRRAAMLAVRKGDWTRAQVYLRRGFLHELLEEGAREAEARSSKTIEKARRYERDPKVRKEIGLAGHGYLDAMDGILELVELRVIPMIRAQRSAETFFAWLDERMEAGSEIVVPDWMRERGQVHWRKLTVSEIEGLGAVLDSIANAARQERVMRIGEETVLRDTVAQGAIRELETGVLRKATRSARLAPHRATLRTALEALRTGDPEALGDTLWAGFRTLQGLLVGKEALVSSLTASDPTSWLFKAFIQPFADAAAFKADYMKGVVVPIRALADDYMRRHAKLYDELVDEQRLANPWAGAPMQFTRRSLLGVALNVGSRSQLEKLLGGFGWWDGDDSTYDRSLGLVMDVLEDHLTDEDWALVQQVWDLLEARWPQIAEHEKRMTGVVPERVEPHAFTTRAGRKMTGGYFPIVYDPSRSERAARQAAERFAKERPGGFGAIETRHSFTKARTKLKTRALKIDAFQILVEHLEEVAHDLAYREAVVSTAKLLQRKDLEDALREHLGFELGPSQFWIPWLKAIGRDVTGSTDILAHPGRWMRTRASAFVMLGRVSTVLIQPSGLFNGWQQVAEQVKGHRVGTGARHAVAARYLIGGLWEAMGHGKWSEATRVRAEAMRRSKVLPSRMDTYDRDLSDLARELAGRQGWDDRTIEFFRHLIAGMQLYAVDLPVWHASFRLGLDQGLSEEDAAAGADSATKLSQGSGDLVANARLLSESPEWVKGTVGFLATYNGAVLNQVAGSWRRHHSIPATAAAVVVSSMFPTLMAAGTGILLNGLWNAIYPGVAPPPPEDDEAWAEKLYDVLGGGLVSILWPLRMFDRTILHGEAMDAPGFLGVWGDVAQDVRKAIGRGIAEGEWTRALLAAIEVAGLSRGLGLGWATDTAERAVREEEQEERTSRGRRGTSRRGGSRR